jgi:hypothetical protein
MGDPVKYEDDEMIDTDDNPWAVNTLEEFLFFCCPECSDRSPSVKSFVHHALSLHPKSRNIIPLVDLQSNSDIDFKEEDIEVDLPKEEWQDEPDSNRGFIFFGEKY